LFCEERSQEGVAVKRKEWVILALIVAGVAALEVFGTGDGSPRGPHSDGLVREATRSAAPADPAAGPVEAYRTVRLHVTGMT
jgi:hypothetical protein